MDLYHFHRDRDPAVYPCRSQNLVLMKMCLVICKCVGSVISCNIAVTCLVLDVPYLIEKWLWMLQQPLPKSKALLLHTAVLKMCLSVVHHLI